MTSMFSCLGDSAFRGWPGLVLGHVTERDDHLRHATGRTATGGGCVAVRLPVRAEGNPSRGRGAGVRSGRGGGGEGNKFGPGGVCAPCTAPVQAPGLGPCVPYGLGCSDHRESRSAGTCRSLWWAAGRGRGPGAGVGGDTRVLFGVCAFLALRRPGFSTWAGSPRARRARVRRSPLVPLHGSMSVTVVDGGTGTRAVAEVGREHGFSFGVCV